MASLKTIGNAPDIAYDATRLRAIETRYAMPLPPEGEDAGGWALACAPPLSQGFIRKSTSIAFGDDGACQVVTLDVELSPSLS